jgi:hypothetical protein
VALVGAVVAKQTRLRALLSGSGAGQWLRGYLIGVDSTLGTRDLTPSEEMALWRTAAAVLPSNPGDEAHREVLDHLRWRARSEPGYAAECVRARAFLDEEASRAFGTGAEFARLAPAQAGLIIGSALRGIVAHQLSAAPRSTLLRLAFSSRFRKRYRLRRHVVNEILLAYYTSSPSWTRLRYRSFPGGCAGLGEYGLPPEAATREGSSMVGGRRPHAAAARRGSRSGSSQP